MKGQQILFGSWHLKKKDGGSSCVLAVSPYTFPLFGLHPHQAAKLEASAPAVSSQPCPRAVIN